MSESYDTGMTILKQHMVINTQYIVTIIIIPGRTPCYKRYS